MVTRASLSRDSGHLNSELTREPLPTLGLCQEAGSETGLAVPEFVNLAPTKITWKEETPTEESPLRDQLFGMSPS